MASACALAILSGNFNIYICVLKMTAVISRTLFTGRVVTVSGIHPPIRESILTKNTEEQFAASAGPDPFRKNAFGVPRRARQTP